MLDLLLLVIMAQKFGIVFAEFVHFRLGVLTFAQQLLFLQLILLQLISEWFNRGVEAFITFLPPVKNNGMNDRQATTGYLEDDFI